MKKIKDISIKQWKKHKSGKHNLKFYIYETEEQIPMCDYQKLVPIQSKKKGDNYNRWLCLKTKYIWKEDERYI